MRASRVAIALALCLSLTGMAISPLSNPRLAAGYSDTPIGYWVLDEASGTIVHDSSAYHNDGQAYNVTWVQGVVGLALYFSGTDDSYVEVPDRPALTPRQQLTIEAWIRPESYRTDTMAILYKGDPQQTGCFGERSYSLWAIADGSLEFSWTPQGSNCQWRCTTDGGAIAINQWSHVKVELDAAVGKVTVNINDIQVLEKVCPTGVIRVGSQPLRIGGMFRSYRNQDNFRGSIDEVKISTTQLVNQEPNRPSNVFPADGVRSASLTTSLQCSAFSDADSGDAHGASEWQIGATPGDYSSPVFDSGVDNYNLAQITLPSGVLNSETTYYWRVRHRDSNGQWSTWSEETSFTTVTTTEYAGTGPALWIQIVVGAAVLLILGMMAYLIRRRLSRQWEQS